MGGHWCPTAQPPPASSALLVGLRDFYGTGALGNYGSTITGYSGSRNRRGYKTRSIPIEHARAQVVRVTRRQPVCKSSRRVGRLRGHRLAGARTRTHSRHNDHLWRATGRGSAAGPPRPRHQPAFDSAEANPRDTQTLRDFLMKRFSTNPRTITMPPWPRGLVLVGTSSLTGKDSHGSMASAAPAKPKAA